MDPDTIVSGRKSRMMIFLADHFSERDNAIAYQFRMLDELRGVAGDSRDQDLPDWGVSRAADSLFMLVTDVAGSILSHNS